MKKIKQIKEIFHSHKTVVDILFLGIYFFEQLFLILLFYFAPQEYSPIIISVFSLLVITTVTLERICMESRYNKIQTRMHTMQRKSQLQLYQGEQLYRKYSGVLDIVEHKTYK